MDLIYNKHVVNDLGMVSCELISDSPLSFNIEENESLTTIRTKSHICQLISINPKEDWLPTGMSVEHSHGWLWTFKKVGTSEENLHLKCYLKPTCAVESYNDSGQYLDALGIENDSKVMHIGTEDPEALYNRAKNSDYMPKRLLKEPSNRDYYQGYTNYIENGFKTEIPGLLENELVYFQYLYAINTRKQSAKYPDEEDSSTWYSVLHDRRFMLNKLGLDLNTDARLPR